MLAGINAEEVPLTWPDRIKVPVRALSAATRWWHEYGKETLLLNNEYFCAKVFMYRKYFVSLQMHLPISAMMSFE